MIKFRSLALLSCRHRTSKLVKKSPKFKFTNLNKNESKSKLIKYYSTNTATFNFDDIDENDDIDDYEDIEEDNEGNNCSFFCSI